MKTRMIMMLAAMTVLTASAQTTFLGGSVLSNENWSAGLPTSPENYGTIATNGTLSAALPDILTDFYFTQTAGIISYTGSGKDPVLYGGSFTQNGGQFGVTSGRAFKLDNGNLTTLNSGSIIGGDKGGVSLYGGSVMVVNGGTLQTYGGNRNILLSGDSVLTINGGTVITLNDFGIGRLASGNSNVININGGTVSVGDDLRFGDNGAKLTINLGGSTAGTLTAADYVAAGDDSENIAARKVNWLPGSQITMTLTNGAADWAETEWNEGRLTYNSQGSNDLSKSWAEVTAENGLESGIRFNYDDVTRSLSLAGAALPPPAPSGLAAVPGLGSVSLDWNDSGADVASYSVFRSVTSGSYGSALVSNLTSSAYVDNAVDNGTTYYYAVTAVKTNGLESGKSLEVSAVPGDYIAPAAPSGLAATAGDNSVSLNWDDNTEDDLGSYSVYRSATSNSYGSALAVNVPSSSYVDSTAVNDTTYYYVVTATDTNGNESAQSAEVSATPNSSGLSGYDLWVSGWSNDIGSATFDYDGDGFANLYEYGVDGDPTDDQDQGTAPIFTKAGDSFIYVHPKRSNDETLTYTVETTTNLLHSGSWSATGYTTGGTLPGNPLDMVTNTVSTVDDEKFIRLKIER